MKTSPAPAAAWWGGDVDRLRVEVGARAEAVRAARAGGDLGLLADRLRAVDLDADAEAVVAVAGVADAQPRAHAHRLAAPERPGRHEARAQSVRVRPQPAGVLPGARADHEDPAQLVGRRAAEADLGPRAGRHRAGGGERADGARREGRVGGRPPPPGRRRAARPSRARTRAPSPRHGHGRSPPGRLDGAARQPRRYSRSSPHLLAPGTITRAGDGDFAQPGPRLSGGSARGRRGRADRERSAGGARRGPAGRAPRRRSRRRPCGRPSRRRP